LSLVLDSSILVKLIICEEGVEGDERHNTKGLRGGLPGISQK